VDEPTTSAPASEVREAYAERLLQAFLDSLPGDSMPVLRYFYRRRGADIRYKELEAVILYAYEKGTDDGYLDGYADGRAEDDNDEPIYNEGWE